MDLIIPPCLPGDEACLRVELEKAGIRTALDENHLLTSDLILRVGRALKLGKTHSLRMHELFYRINSAVEANPDAVKATRYYLCGDYCGTAVANYVNTTLTCFVDERRAPCSTWPKLYTAFKAVIDTDAGCQSLRTMTSLTEDGLEVATCDISLRICFASSSHGAGPKLSEMATTIYSSLERASREERVGLSNALAEIYARLINIVPDNWRSFIRFCKLWTMRNVSGLSMEIVEAMALKVLVNRDPKLQAASLEYDVLYFEFLMALCSQEERNLNEAVCLPPTAFSSTKVDALNDKFAAYGPQPQIMCDMEALRSRFCRPESITSIIDPSRDLSTGVTKRGWKILRIVSEEALLRDEEGQMGLRDLFAMTESGPTPISSGQRGGLVHTIRILTAMAVMSTILASLLGLLTIQIVAIFLCRPDGDLNMASIVNLESHLVQVFSQFEWRLQTSTLQPILNSGIYNYVTDQFEHLLQFMIDEKAVNDMWSMVPIDLRMEAVKNTHYFEQMAARVSFTWSRFRPQMVLLQKMLDKKVSDTVGVFF